MRGHAAFSGAWEWRGFDIGWARAEPESISLPPCLSCMVAPVSAVLKAFYSTGKEVCGWGSWWRDGSGLEMGRMGWDGSTVGSWWRPWHSFGLAPVWLGVWLKGMYVGRGGGHELFEETGCLNWSRHGFVRQMVRIHVYEQHVSTLVTSSGSTLQGLVFAFYKRRF